MKKITNLRLASFLLALLMVSTAFAQSDNGVVVASLKTGKPASAATETENNKTSAAIDTKVLHSFEQSFKDAQHTYWKTTKNRSVAEFETGDRHAVVLFNKNGHILHSILYGTAEHLPAAEKTLVLSAYRDYEITNTQEITTGATRVWLVSLQNSMNIIRVRVYNSELDELERFQRSK